VRALPAEHDAIDGLLAGGIAIQNLRDEGLQGGNRRKEPVATRRQRLIKITRGEGRMELSAQLGMVRPAGMMRDTALLALGKRSSRICHENGRWIGGLCVVSRLTQYRNPSSVFINFIGLRHRRRLK
jgi:hypothetical protein